MTAALQTPLEFLVAAGVSLFFTAVKWIAIGSLLQIGWRLMRPSAKAE